MQLDDQCPRENAGLEPGIRSRAAYRQRRSSNANGLCWRLLAEQKAIIPTSQMARARISEFESYMPSHAVGLCGLNLDAYWRARIVEALDGDDLARVGSRTKGRAASEHPNADY